MMQLKYAEWQQNYEAVLLARDPSRIATLVEATETAMFFRLRELCTSPNGHDERQAISDAANRLPSIKTEILGFPGVEFIDPKEAQAEPQPD